MKRKGFTLIELLIVVGILTFLVGITAASMRWAAQNEKPKFGANEVSTMLSGAQSRATDKRRSFGVRFILNQSGPTKLDASGVPTPCTVTSMMYVQSPQPFIGTAEVDQNDLRTFIVSDPDWARYEQFLDPAATELYVGPKGSLPIYRVMEKVGNDWQLTADWIPNVVERPDQYVDLKFETVPQDLWIAPETKPNDLPKGVCIDLEASRIAGRLPEDWYDPTTGQYVQDRMQIVFEPKGGISNKASAWGIVDFVVAHVEDVESSTYGATFYNISSRKRSGHERIVAISAATGKMRVSPVRLTDTNNNDVPDDPFRYAETGGKY